MLSANPKDYDAHPRRHLRPGDFLSLFKIARPLPPMAFPEYIGNRCDDPACADRERQGAAGA